MKRLTSLKSSSSSDANAGGSSNKRSNGSTKLKGKRQNGSKNNPYPLSGTFGSLRRNANTSHSASSDQPYVSQPSLINSGSENNTQGNSAKSAAPTLSTNGDTTRSEAAYSKAGTMATGGGGVTGGGEGSTFSSPAPSVRSMTTTLTTVQSAAPSTTIYGLQNNQPNNNGSSLPHVDSTHSAASQQVQFSHQFPPSPASAVPPHVVMNGQPTTYNSATANNLLTDNASILTLASSSKRRRRNSLDTNASVRALAPSSIFGGSRESLPLSVLSANVGDASNASVTNASGVLSRPSIGGLASAERASVYSSSGVAPLVAAGGERSSLIASKQGDTGSVRSGIHSHTRNDSTTGSIGGTAGGSSALTSPIAGLPSSTQATGRISRRSSGWGEIAGDGDGQHREEDEQTSQDEVETGQLDRPTDGMLQSKDETPDHNTGTQCRET